MSQPIPGSGSAPTIGENDATGSPSRASRLTKKTSSSSASNTPRASPPGHQTHQQRKGLLWVVIVLSVLMALFVIGVYDMYLSVSRNEANPLDRRKDVFGQVERSVKKYIQEIRTRPKHIGNVSVSIGSIGSGKTSQNVTYKRLMGGFGRLCNQLVIISAGLSMAKRDGFILIIEYGNFPVLDKIDLNLFERTFKGLFVFKSHKHPENEHIKESEVLVSAPTYWCGLKTKLESIRKGIRPNEKFRKMAQNQVAKMRTKLAPNSDLISVHVRNYDGLCENLLPDACEWRSGYEFKPKPFGCNQTLTVDYLASIKADFPEHDWSNRRMSMYLSTDRQVESVDLSYRLHHTEFGVDEVFEPEKVKSRKVKNEYTSTSELFVDMWISVLADFYVAMPRSSCEKIIAEWRGVVNRDGTEKSPDNNEDERDRVYPRQCFRNYFYTGPEPEKETCPHVTFLALDTKHLPAPESSICAVCEFLLALSVALSKATRQGRQGLHLYGPWGQFVRENLDLDKLKEHVLDLSFRDTDEWVLHDRMQIYDSAKLRGSAVRADNQAKCARGKHLDHLSALSVLPRREIIQEVESSMSDDAKQFRKAHKEERNGCSLSRSGERFCFEGSSTCSKEADEDGNNSADADEEDETSHKSVVHDLWERVLSDEYQFEVNSPCSQVVALWRTGMNKHIGDENFNGFAESREASELSGFKKDVYWNCP